MAIIQSDWALGRKPMPVPMGAHPINVLLTLPVTAAQTALADIYSMGYLPEDCVLVDAVFAATDIDTAGSAAHVMSFGILTDNESDLTGSALQASITVGQAGTAARLTPTVATLTTSCDGKTRKKLGFKVTTASGTGAAGTVYLSLTYRAAQYGA